MVYISCIAIINKNIPNIFLNLFTSVWIDKFAPTIAPKIPNNEIIIATLNRIFLFFIFTIIAAIDVGIKNIKFVACAMCCSNPQIFVNKKIHENMWKTNNKQYLFELQKFLDLADNIKDEKLRKNIISQMLKCDKYLTKIAEEELKNKER